MMIAQRCIAAISKLRRFAGVSEAGARSRNPEGSEGSTSDPRAAIFAAFYIAVTFPLRFRTIPFLE
jgi:hypothetical protein